MILIVINKVNGLIALRILLDFCIHIDLILILFIQLFFFFRATALQTLLDLGQYNHWNDLPENHQFHLAETFSNFLPGITLATTRIATASDIQGHRTTSVCSWNFRIFNFMFDDLRPKITLKIIIINNGDNFFLNF